MALVACAVVATAGVLVIVTLQARRAEQALDRSAAQTRRDYTGYAGRMAGAEVMRRFSEQRAAILSPVSGSALRDATPPTLNDIVQRGNAYFATFKGEPDPSLGYFRLDMRTGKLDGTGSMHGPLAVQIVDTLRIVLATKPSVTDPEILALNYQGTPQSVAYSRLIDKNGEINAVFGFTYDRAHGISAIASRVFRETPLLPSSYSGSRWNYDTTSTLTNEIKNDQFLGMRIADRAGHLLWQSKSAAAAATSPFRERIVLSTSTGGLIVETALLPAGEPSLIPSIVRRAQNWSLGALLALTAMLAGVSLVALGGERLHVRERRAEAMQQLALGLRHELNNALASVMLNAELMSEETLDPAHRASMDSIVEQADRMRLVLRRLETADRLDVVVPYLNEGFMVDLSAKDSSGGTVNRER
ncbi:MAG: histidine kinase dimerization/phospho-acceptor domain-containing protein [bacterium]